MSRVAPMPVAVDMTKVEDLDLGQTEHALIRITDIMGSADLNNDGVVEAWEQDVYSRMMAADHDGDGYLTRSQVLHVMRGVHEEEKGGIPISSLNPDTDGDGDVADWEQECYDKIVAADADGGGSISVKELFGVIKSASDEVKEAQKGGIPITSLNPDTDGDGKVEKWEMEVFGRINAADEDKSGSISVKELFGVIKGAAEADRQKKLLAKMLGVAIALIIFLVCAIGGMTVAVVASFKDAYVAPPAPPTSSMLADNGTADAVLTERRKLAEVRFGAESSVVVNAWGRLLSEGDDSSADDDDLVDADVEEETDGEAEAPASADGYGLAPSSRAPCTAPSAPIPCCPRLRPCASPHFLSLPFAALTLMRCEPCLSWCLARVCAGMAT